MDITTFAGLLDAMPDNESVTYEVANASDGYDAGVTLDDARRRDISLTERAVGNIGLTDNVVSWRLWASQLGTVVPKPGDRVTDSANKKWIIVGVPQVKLLRQVYHCMAQGAA